MLTLETIKLLRSTKKVVDKDKNWEIVPKLYFFEVVLVHPQQTFLVFQDVFKTSWRCLQRNTFRLPRRLQDVLSKRLVRRLASRLQDVFKTSSRRICKTSCNYAFKTSSRRLGRQKSFTLKTSSVRLHQDECLLGYNLVPNDYQHTSKVLFSFVPNKQFGQLINISPHSLTMMNTVNTEFSFVEVWFIDQTSKALEIEDNVNLTLIIG